ncbi:DUF1990 family protein [Rubrivirga sp.]|uniref:DUF1990 family protein n=1 Tax=Rubrivirga sp. TaxID=1885344 RepID=UPI003C786EE8
MRKPLAWIALSSAAGLGIYALARWGYPVVARTFEVYDVPDGPLEDVPEPPDRADVQGEEDGEGARFHRTYSVTIRGSDLEAEGLMAQVKKDVQRFVPDEVARFEKTVGAGDQMSVGDEYHIHISAPWDGPVRVGEVTDTSFTLVTLEDHLEAGQIRFTASDLEGGGVGGDLHFVIESWARSRDAVVDVMYDDLGIAKKAQQAMWTFFCNRVVEVSGGEAVGEIEVVTEREADDA